jgi:hypothetical protein
MMPLLPGYLRQLFSNDLFNGEPMVKFSQVVRRFTPVEKIGVWIEVTGSSPNLTVTIQGSHSPKEDTFAEPANPTVITITAAGKYTAICPEVILPAIRFCVKANGGNGADTRITMRAFQGGKGGLR